MTKLSYIVGHPAGITENCLGWRKTLLVTRSKMFCMSSKGDTQEQNTVGKNWVFPYIGGKKPVVFSPITALSSITETDLLKFSTVVMDCLFLLMIVL